MWWNPLPLRRPDRESSLPHAKRRKHAGQYVLDVKRADECLQFMNRRTQVNGRDRDGDGAGLSQFAKRFEFLRRLRQRRLMTRASEQGKVGVERTVVCIETSLDGFKKFVEAL